MLKMARETNSISLVFELFNHFESESKVSLGYAKLIQFFL